MTRAPDPELPTGTVTFLFTDVEASTRILQAIGDRYVHLLEEHARLIREALRTYDGVEVSTDGDAFFVVFPYAGDAVAAVVDAQRALHAYAWPEEAAIRVRMGLHTGAARRGGDTYAGIDVNRAARIAAAGHGGQVLLSGTTQALIAGILPAGVKLNDLGLHRLKDLDEPERLYELSIAGLPNRFPPPRGVDAVRNLPPPMTSFVGRAAEIADVPRLLEVRRLLTLVGPGGTGKTRLAIEVGRRSAGDFDDGVYFVALEAIRDPALVASAIAETLSVRQDGRPAEEVLVRHLAGKHLLLILDNMEQVLPAASLIDELLAAAPELRVLATSRVPLRVSGEQEYGVEPLRIPASTALPAGKLSRYEAVALFVQRARAVRPAFVLTEENAAPVAEIAMRLDGLPLAIELAAARLKLLPPEAIAARLADRLDLFATNSPSVPPRQRTLRAVIDWSWDLLGDREQRLVERLSVFAGSWDLEAAETVGGADELGIEVLDGLASLLDNSLVHRGEDGEPRYRMLQTVQQYAREQLVRRGEETTIARRHATHFRGLAEAAEPEFVGRDPGRCVRRLVPDQDNFRTALDWAIAAGETEVGVRLASAIWRFWQERGLLREGRHWLERLLTLPDLDAGSTLRARALTATGGVAYWQGDEAARGYYGEALAIYRALDDARGIADSLQNLAFTVMSSQLDEGIELFEESLARYRELNDTPGAASVMGALGYARLMTGDYDEARARLTEALELNVAHGMRGRANDERFALGHIHRLTGEVPAAAANYRSALADSRDMADAGRMLMHLRGISFLVSKAGRHREALVLHGAAERAREQQGGTIAVPLPGATDAAAQARAAHAMGETEIADALAAGRATDFQAAVDLALSLLDELTARPVG